MAYGIELRLPFLEHEFVELGLSLPNWMYFLDGYTKGIIRRGFDGYMPESVRLAKKRSIQAPQGEWLRAAQCGIIYGICCIRPSLRRGVILIFPSVKISFKVF